MHRLTRLTGARRRRRLPHAAQQPPAQRLLAGWLSHRRAARQARRLRAQLGTQTTRAQ